MPTPKVTKKVYRFTPEERGRIQALMRNGMDPQQAIKVVADERAEAQRQKITLCVPAPDPAPTEPPAPPPPGPSPTPTRRYSDHDNPVMAARMILGTRLTESHGGYFLDSGPCDLDRMMREANRLRKERGLPPLGRNPNWRV